MRGMAGGMRACAHAPPQLPGIPSAVFAFTMASNEGATPAIAAAVQGSLLVFRNLKPSATRDPRRCGHTAISPWPTARYYKFTLPSQALPAEELEVWAALKAAGAGSAVDMEAVTAQLSAVRHEGLSPRSQVRG